MSKQDVVTAQLSALQAAETQAKTDVLGATYDAAFSEGVASVPPADADEQAKIDAAVAAAIAPLNQQISDLTAKDAADVASLTDLQSKLVALQANFDALTVKEAGEASTLQSLQAAKDALAKVLADLSVIGVPVPAPAQ